MSCSHARLCPQTNSSPVPIRIASTPSAMSLPTTTHQPPINHLPTAHQPLINHPSTTHQPPPLPCQNPTGKAMPPVLRAHANNDAHTNPAPLHHVAADRHPSTTHQPPANHHLYRVETQQVRQHRLFHKPMLTMMPISTPLPSTTSPLTTAHQPPVNHPSTARQPPPLPC